MIRKTVHIIFFVVLVSLFNVFVAQTDSIHFDKLQRIKNSFKSCVPCSEDSLYRLRTLYLDSVYKKEQLYLTILEGQAIKRNGNYQKTKILFDNTVQNDSIFPISSSSYYFDFLINYGNIYYNLELYDSAISIHKNTLYLLNQNKEIEDRIRYTEMVYSNLTNVYTDQLDFGNAIQLLLKATENDFSQSFHINQNLARQFSELKMYDEAIVYYRKSLTLTDDVNLIASSFLNLGAIYDKKKNKDSALYCMRKCLDTVKSIQTKIYCLYNLTDYYLSLKDYNTAGTYIDSGLFIANTMSSLKYKRLFDLSSGTLAFKKKEYEKALFFYQKIDLEIIPWVDFHLEYYNNYRQVCKALNKTEKAYDLLNKYTILKDSIDSYKNEVKFVSIIHNYRLQKQQDEIKILAQSSVLLKQDKEIKAQQALLLTETIEMQRKRIIWISSLIFVFGLGVYLFLKYRLNKKEIEHELLIEKQKLKEIEIENLNQKMESEKLKSGLKGEEKERERLASELHDGIGSALTGLRLKMHTKQRNDDFELELSNIYNEVRLISHRLSPPIENDIKKLVVGITARFFDYTPIKYSVNWFPENYSFEIKDSEKINFYRILQEVYNNIIKHSKSVEIEISVNISENKFNIIIEDNGVGFNHNEYVDSFGMRSLNQRAKALNAHLVIDCKINRGTSVSLTFNQLNYD